MQRYKKFPCAQKKSTLFCNIFDRKSNKPTFQFSESYENAKKIFPHIFDRAYTGKQSSTNFVNFAAVKKSCFILLALLSSLLVLQGSATAPKFEKIKGHVMGITIDEQGDTMYLDQIDPIWIFPKGKGMKKGDWRRFYKTVYNFNKVYPYALVGRKMMQQVNAELSRGKIKRAERNKYVNEVEKELFKLFEKDIRKMTITQGVLLVRLVDRECGMSGYEIIKTYENGFAAGFWQLVAKIFDQDLKSRYDPKGKDLKTEELVKIWDSGGWDSFYFSIFYEYPPAVNIARDSLNTTLQRSGESGRARRKRERARK